MEVRRLLMWKKIEATVILRCLLANHLSVLFPRQSDVPWSSQCEVWSRHRKVK